MHSLQMPLSLARATCARAGFTRCGARSCSPVLHAASTQAHAHASQSHGSGAFSYGVVSALAAGLCTRKGARRPARLDVKAKCSQSSVASPTIAKPDSHKRTYSYLKLGNGLQAIIGSDADCDKAGAALCVNVGMCHERKDLPGLAHFLEHMLFTGTKKYPSEGEYSEFISQNGGMSNAYTACYYTNYYFDIKPEMLEPALDRFARFFSEPLLTRDCTEREINAVDSEFQGGVTEPWWRFIGIINQSANPDHPFHVAVGNNKVLLEEPKERGIDLYDEMTKLYNDTYSANGMSLCVFGRESVAELEAMVKDKFGSILDKGFTMPVGDGVSEHPPFLQQDWNRVLLQNPVKDIKTLTFSWVIPYQTPLWRKKPTRYINHLLGHEGAGSVIAVLKEQGLISQSYPSNGAWLEGAFSLYNVNFELTEKGLDNVDLIGKHLFAYIGMLQQMPPEKWIFDEMARLGEQRFKFGEDSQAISLCPSIVENLCKGVEPSEVLAGGSLLYEYDPEAISSVLSRLTLDSVRVNITAKSLAERCTDKDTSYESPIAFEALGSERLDLWSEVLEGGASAAEALGLRLPTANPFIAEDLSIKPLPEEGSPKVPTSLPIENLTPVSCIYHRQDDKFKQPKAQISFKIYTPFPSSSEKSWVCAELWCIAVQEGLLEYAYDAEVAGLSYRLSLDEGAIRLSLGGFNDKLPVLLDAVTGKMLSMLEVPDTLYSIIADSYGNNLKNAAFRQQPYMQCSMRFNELSKKGFTVPSYRKLKIFESLKREDLNNMAERLFQKSHVEVLSLGNLLPEEVKGLASALVKGLQLQEPLTVLPEKAEAVLPSGSTVWSLPSTDEDSPNHAVFLRMQLPDSVENAMQLNLLSTVLSSKFFDQLRTQQQLGYIVALQNGRSDRFVYLVAVVQTEFPPDYARGQIDAFLEEQFKFVETELAEEEFETCRQGVLSDLKVKPKNLGEEMSRFNGQFSSRKYDFERIDRAIAYVESSACSLDALRAFVREQVKAAPAFYSQCKKVLDKEDKELPAGGQIPVDPETLRSWTSHTETVEEFAKTAEWLPLNNEVASKS
eukprot:TRINITY_DN96305_c0_g1_i1.p1 TRINITY_DN96305_c0_g1~~TRINITY_DN96305_c0_g1_i1.p1  ORF type:complete len:1087 (+),score=247.13 TRINITY_DN96305_c0_g1_i1:70-3261(+)